MKRPKVPDEHAEKLEEIVDAETKLPASSLTFAEQLEYLLDTYQDRKRSEDRLEHKISQLESQLDKEGTTNTPTVSRNDPFGR